MDLLTPVRLHALATSASTSAKAGSAPFASVLISPHPLINSGVMILLIGGQLPMLREGWLLVALRQT